MISGCSRRHALLSALGLLALPVAADEPKPVTPSYNNMSDEQEVSFGRELSQQIEKEGKLKFLENSSMHHYANEILQRLAKTSRRQHLDYSVKIVDTADLNASALPGGFVYLNRGLMQWARTEAEMVSVLAHEVGHVAARHGANAICRANAADSLLTEASRILLGDDTPARILRQLGGPMAVLALLRYDRYQESEADLLGFYNMQRAGWHPDGMVNLFKRLDERSGGLDSIFVIASDHPASGERAEQIRDEMKKFPPAADLAMNSREFESMQKEMKKLPPPKPARSSSQG